MTRPALRVVLFITAVILSVLPAAAQTYRWIDDQGNPHYAEGLDSIPERFRGTFYDDTHSFRPAMQEEAFDWLDRWL